MEQRTADIIVNQIKSMDPAAFMAWGSDEFISFPTSETDLGALRFRVRNCRTFKGKALIKITLEFNDTYSVKLYKLKNSKAQLKKHIDNPDFKPSDFENVLSLKNDVYFDELIPTIDEMLGEVK